jgi:hypothetical protein
MSFYICIFSKFFFQHHIQIEDFNTFSTHFHLISLQLNLDPNFELNWILIQFKVYYNVVHASIPYRNELMFHASKTFGILSCFAKTFFFPCFPNVFSLGTNKEDLLYVRNYNISLLPFGQNSFISRLFQHVISLAYINMCCLIRFHVDILTLFERLLAKEHMLMQKVRRQNCLCIHK